MRLEAEIKRHHDYYPYNHGPTISILPAIDAILDDMRSGTELGIIAARFHNTIVDIVKTTVALLGKETGLKTVALSGGVFQNRYILEKCEEQLQGSNFKVISQHHMPVNDGGISLGQLASAAARARR